MGNPAIQVKGKSSISQNPFAVVTPGNMKMRSCCNPTFAGRVSNIATLVKEFACFHTTSFCDMQKKQHPTGLFFAITVEIKHDDTVT
jgi:hypothetical protein